MGFLENRKIRNVAEHGSTMEVDLLADEMRAKGDLDAYAFLWISLANRVDDPGVWFTVGMIYEHGTGVPRDLRRAFSWYERAADNGMDSDDDAMYKLGYFYENGYAVSMDLDAAYQWYRKAASHGNDRAREALARF